MVGSRTFAALAQKMRMPVTDVQALVAKGKVPEPYDVEEIVDEAKNVPSANPFHVRNLVDKDIWFKQAICERMRIGRGFYDHPARTAGFKGFDPEKVAVYEN
jgi:hypothetical protein